MKGNDDNSMKSIPGEDDDFFRGEKLSALISPDCRRANDHSTAAEHFLIFKHDIECVRLNTAMVFTHKRSTIVGFPYKLVWENNANAHRVTELVLPA